MMLSMHSAIDLKQVSFLHSIVNFSGVAPLLKGNYCLLLPKVTHPDGSFSRNDVICLANMWYENITHAMKMKYIRGDVLHGNLFIEINKWKDEDAIWFIAARSNGLPQRYYNDGLCFTGYPQPTDEAKAAMNKYVSRDIA